MSSLSKADVGEVRGNRDAEYNYSVGMYMEKFFKASKERKLLGIRCPVCKKTYVPPRMICESCFAETKEWTELQPKGTVLTYTVAHVNVDGANGVLNDLAKPEIIALIKIAGADSAIVHRICEAKPDSIKISAPVEIVWAEETCGGPSDIKYFRPTK